jgi:hypothetical protein
MGMDAHCTANSSATFPSKLNRDGGALPAVLAVWILRIQHEVMSAGGDTAAVDERMALDLRDVQGLVGGSEFSQVLRLYYGAYARKDENIQACALQWLKGEYTTRTQAKADLGVRRIIDDVNVYDSLKLLAAPKPDPFDPDHHLANNGAAKTGLTKSLLSRNLGKIKAFTKYKCGRVGLLFVEVSPAGTSTECPACHHKDPRSRISQADFCCVRCGHREHADVLGGINVARKTFQKITEISPETSIKNARPPARKGRPPKAVLLAAPIGAAT